MKKIWLAVGIVLLFVGTCIIPSIAQDIGKPLSESRGNWLYVGGDGPGNYTRIQDAIKNAINGDTIYVFHGIYNESFAIDKSITIFGEDKNNTVIDGQSERTSVVELIGNNIYLSGFTICHSSYYTNGFGLAIFSDSSNNIVTNNIIADNQGFYGGIFIEGDYNQISHNILRSNSGRGILISHTASNNIFSENDISGSPRGLWVSSCSNNVFTKNHIHNNSLQGIWIAGTEGNDFTYNTIENNVHDAILCESDASNDIIKENIIKNNGEGLVIYDAQSLVITMNSFYGEGIQLLRDELNYLTSHTISNNFINEKPIYFLKSERDVIVPSDAGQVILVDCTNCIMENLNISNVDYGIQLILSQRNTISNNQFKNITGNAIRLRTSQENEIFDNRIFNSKNGVFIGALSNFTNIHNNIIENNYAGVYIDFSYFNTLSKNNFINNSEYQIGYLVNYILPKSNKFKQNYYDDAGNFIKIISGKVRMRYTSYDKSGEIMYFYRRGFIIDWHPAQEPYDIPGMR